MAGTVGIRYRDGRQQGFGIGVEGVAVQRVPVAQLDDAAQIHHRHPIGDVLDHRQVVRHEQQRQLQLRLQFPEQVEYLCLYRDVQRRHRFVGDDEVGTEDQGPGDADPLPLTSGELMRVAAGMGGLQPYQLEHLPDPLATLLLVRHPVEAQSLRDRVANLSAGVKRSEGILEDDLRPPAKRLEGLPTQVGDVIAVEADHPAGGLQQPDQHPAQCRLATPRLADEPEGLSPHDVEVDSGDGVDRGHPALQRAPLHRELLDQVADFHEVLSHRRALPPHRASNAPRGPERSRAGPASVGCRSPGRAAGAGRSGQRTGSLEAGR